MAESTVIEIRVSCPDEDVARRVGDALLDARLIAVAHTYPARTSRYRWQGEVAERAEIPLVVRTRAVLFEEVAGTVAKHHPDKVPSISAIRVDLVTGDYRDWIWGETRPEPGTPKSD
jgi:periplasmic divalent cation tolerance protein